MTFKTVTKPSDVREDLRMMAAAALAVGLIVWEYDAGRGATALHVHRMYFNPLADDRAFMLLLQTAQDTGFVFDGDPERVARIPLVVRIVVSAEDTRCQVGTSKWYTADHRMLGAFHAMSMCVVEAFAAQYQGEQ